MRKVAIFCVFLLGAISPALAQHTAPAASPVHAASNTKIDAAIAKLYELHFWTGKTCSLKEDANRQAIIAFQKLAGLPRTGKLTDSTVARIMASSIPSAHISLHEQHLEVDLDHQVLLVVDPADQVNRILPVSTGSGQQFDYPDKGTEFARTPRGKFKVYYKVAGWKESALGLMFDPMYFSGGFALHGDNSVPAKPASHGCVRIPMFAAEEMFRVTPIGTPVIVYGENPKPEAQMN
jgi:lipoprotein-anchoring transpeptidase ErfK/SrfK